MAKYLTTDEVAEMLRTPPETVRYWRHIGKGPTVQARSARPICAGGRRVLHRAGPQGRGRGVNDEAPRRVLPRQLAGGLPQA